MKTEVTDLAKSLGIKKIGPLKFRDDDNLYKKFQKLLKYVYKNGDWTSADTAEALRKMFDYRIKETNGTLEKIASDDISIPKYKATEGFSGEVYEYKWGKKGTNGAPFVTYLFVDTDNRSGAKHGKRFRGPDVFGRTGRVSSTSIFDKEGMLFNVDRLIGFSQVEKLLMSEYQRQRSDLGFSEANFRTYLRVLVNPSMASKKEAWRFSDDKRLYGDMVKFIDNYVGSVYELVVQHDYEKSLESQFRADPSTTKLNINEETQQVMDNTKLKQYFGFVELDNEVDLERFKDFEAEMHRVQAVLPTVENVKPDLRLRKLGNYKALGIYFPFNNTIALDFRSGSTENRGEYRPSQPGIQSFIHEYGHYLDYNLSKGDGFMNSLSLEPEFKKIINKYVEQLKVNGIYDHSHGKTDHYYAVPTEVFARSFEVYAFEKGLRTSLMKNDYSKGLEYVSFTPEIREEITKYFDEKIPDFGDRIRSLVENEKVEEQGTDQGQDKTEGTKKEGREYAPSLQFETEGSGPPDQENLIHEFDRPSSYLDFNMNLDKKPRQIRGFHVANQDDLELLNKYSQQLKESAEFYKNNMSKGNVVYVFKQNDEIKALRVKYGEENFAHLVGIRFDRKNASEMLDDIVNGNGEQNAIFLKNDGSTFEKLKVISSINKLVDNDIFTLTNVAENVTQARKLRFDEALKVKDENLLLALKDFEPEVYRPYSLINLENIRSNYSDYSSVPDNTVLAVLSETRSEFGGISIGTLSINHDYVKNTADAMEIINVMNDLSIKKLEKEERSQENKVEEQTPDEKSNESVEKTATKENEAPDNNRESNGKQIEEQTSVENKPETDQKINVDQEKIKLTEKQIDLAKNQDILAVAQDLKLELVFDNGSYYWKEDPELVIDPRTKTFTWKKKDVYRGDSVKLVQEIKDIPFSEAVKYLNDTEIVAFDHDKVSYKLNDDQISSVQAQQEENNVNTDPARSTEINKAADTKQTTATNVPKRVSKKQINDARNRNILEVAQELGMNLKRQGQTYSWIEHDSLVIFPKTNTYNWYSRAKVGKNPIDLVESVKGLDFKGAVAYLNDSKITEFDESKLQNEPQKPFKYLLKDSNDVSKLKTYFVKERKLSEQTVNDFLRSGVLAQANRIDRTTKEFEPVAVFKHRDINGNLIGASLQGVKANWEKYPVHGYRKEIISNSAQNRGITYNNGLEKGQNSYKMIFFEAPIDMMSYYELHKDQLAGTRLVALNGLKDNTIGKHIVESFGFSSGSSLEDLNKYFKDNGLTAADVKKRFADLGASLKIAVDNDVSGREFIEKLNKKYPLIPFESELPPMLKGRGKTDWNDYLKASKTDIDFEIVKESKKKIETVDSPVITEDGMDAQVLREQKYEDQSIQQEERSARSEEAKRSEKRVDGSKQLPDESSKESPEQERQTANPITQRTADKEINVKEFDIENASARELGAFAMKQIREFSKDPKTWDEYMTMLGRFPEYSPRNVALIYTQAKDSQMLGTFKQWQERHEKYGLTKEDIMYDETIATKLKEAGREYEQKLSIRSGESGKVSLFKIKKELYLPRTDEAGNVLYDDSGNVKYKKYHKNKLSDMENKLIEEKKIETKAFPARDRTGALRFVKYKAFDISQTNLRKESYSKVAGKHLYNYEAESSKLYKISYALKDYAKSNNIAYAIDKRRLTGMGPKTKGIYRDDPINGASVLMNKNLDFNESLGTAIRLLSHGVIDKTRDKNEVPKFQRGLEAEIMGHAVAAHYGLKTEKRWLNEMSEKLQDLTDKQLSKSLSVASKSGRDFIQKIAKYSDTPKRQRDRSTKKNIANTRSRGIGM